MCLRIFVSLNKTNYFHASYFENDFNTKKQLNIRNFNYFCIYLSYVERMPMIGETLMGKKFQMGFGGKGSVNLFN